MHKVAVFQGTPGMQHGFVVHPGPGGGVLIAQQVAAVDLPDHAGVYGADRGIEQDVGHQGGVSSKRRIRTGQQDWIQVRSDTIDMAVATNTTWKKKSDMPE